MSTQTDCIFITGPLFSGLVETFNKSIPEQLFTSMFTGSHKITFKRPTAELPPLDIAVAVNTPATLAQIDGALNPNGALRTSAVRAQMFFWAQVPYFLKNPAKHKFFDQLVSINFDFFIHTPWFCSNIHGTISFFVIFALDGSKHLVAKADAPWFEFSGGSICAGKVSDLLTSALNKAQGAVVQPALDKAIAIAKGVPFQNLYLIPGNANRVPPVEFGSADISTSLCLVP